MEVPAAANPGSAASGADDRGILHRLASVARLGPSSTRRPFASHATWSHDHCGARAGPGKPPLSSLASPVGFASAALPFLPSSSCTYRLESGDRVFVQSSSGLRPSVTRSPPNETRESLSSVLQPGEDIAAEESCKALTVQLSVVSVKHPYRHEYQSKPLALDSLLTRGAAVADENITLYRRRILDESDAPVESSHPLYNLLMETAPPEIVICAETAAGSVSLGDSAIAEGAMLDRATTGCPPYKAGQQQRRSYGCDAHGRQPFSSCPEVRRRGQALLSSDHSARFLCGTGESWIGVGTSTAWGKISMSSSVTSSLRPSNSDPSSESQVNVLDQACDKTPGPVTPGVSRSGTGPAAVRPASRHHLSAAVQVAWDTGSETNLRTFVWQTAVRTVKLFAPFWLINRHPAPLLVVQPHAGLPLRVDYTDWRALSCGHLDGKLSLRLGLAELLDLEDAGPEKGLYPRGPARIRSPLSCSEDRVDEEIPSAMNDAQGVVVERKVVSGCADGGAGSTRDAQHDATASYKVGSSLASSALAVKSLSPVFRVDVVGRVSQVVIPNADVHGGIFWRVLRGCSNRQTAAPQRKHIRSHWLGVIVSLAPPPFVRTKVVSVFSRFTLVNFLPSDIWISEGGSPATGGGGDACSTGVSSSRKWFGGKRPARGAVRRSHSLASRRKDHLPSSELSERCPVYRVRPCTTPAAAEGGRWRTRSREHRRNRFATSSKRSTWFRLAEGCPVQVWW